MDEEATATDSSITKLSLTELLASNYLRRLTFLFDHEFTAIQQHHSIVLDTERKSLNGAKLSLLVAKAIHSIDFNNTKTATTVTDTSEDQAIDTINNEDNNKNQFLNNFQIKFKLPKVQADDDDINKVGKLILLNAEYDPPLSRATANCTNPSSIEEVPIANEVVGANLENKLSYIDIIQNIGHIIHTIFSNNKVSDSENNVGYIDGSNIAYGGDSLVVVENSNNINVDEAGEGDKDLLSRNAKMRRSQTNTIFSALGKYDALKAVRK